MGGIHHKKLKFYYLGLPHYPCLLVAKLIEISNRFTPTHLQWPTIIRHAEEVLALGVVADKATWDITTG
jgi:hypothetical protein